jgi:hypothetical protein
MSHPNHSTNDIEKLFQTLSSEKQTEVLQNLVETMKPQRPSTPPTSTSNQTEKRGLKSPHTLYKGGSRKVPKAYAENKGYHITISLIKDREVIDLISDSEPEDNITKSLPQPSNVSLSSLSYIHGNIHDSIIQFNSIISPTIPKSQRQLSASDSSDSLPDVTNLTKYITETSIAEATQASQLLSLSSLSTTTKSTKDINLFQSKAIHSKRYDYFSSTIVNLCRQMSTPEITIVDIMTSDSCWNTALYVRYELSIKARS